MNISLCGSSFTPIYLFIQIDTLSDLIASNDDSCEDDAELSFVSDGVSTYVIMVEGLFMDSGDYTIQLNCLVIPSAPENCDEVYTLSDEVNFGSSIIGGEASEKIAFDIPTNSQSYEIYGFDTQLLGDFEALEIKLYDNINGKPVNELGTSTANIHSVEEVVGGYSNVKILFDSPFELQPNSTYWIVLEGSEGTFIKTNTSTDQILANHDLLNTNYTDNSWVTTNNAQYIFSLICENLSIKNANQSNLKYYPNPTKDYFNVVSDKKVISILGLNLAGQTVFNKKSLVENKIDMRNLMQGVYIFKVTLEDGTVETIKIIKK